jgi:hypothetical protein
MPLSQRNLVPIVEPRHRHKHRPSGGPASRSAAPPPPRFEPASPGRVLASTALAAIRHARRQTGRPAAWSLPGFAREVDLVRLHLRPIRTRQLLAASFGREAFHAGPSDAWPSAGASVTVAYVIRWLELGDGVERPRFEVWLAESASGPIRLTADGDPAGAGASPSARTIASGIRDAPAVPGGTRGSRRVP